MGQLEDIRAEASTLPDVSQVGAIAKEEIALLRKAAQESFYFFAKAVLGYSKLTPHLHKELCDKLQADDWKEFLGVLPRTFFKTTIATISFPLWLAVRKLPQSANIRILIVQNSSTNAEKKLGAIAQHVLSNQLFRLLFPEVLPTPQNVWRADSLCLTRTENHPESTFECGGTRTKYTSRHYDVIIEDDTVSPDLDNLQDQCLIPSQDDIAQAIGFHRNAVPLRVSAKESRMLVIGTRWYARDLISYIKENSPHYKVYERGVLEKDGKIDPNGDPIWPEEFDLQTIQSIKAEMGPYLFNCLYLNNPLNPKDMVFCPEWFRYYDCPPKKLMVFTTVDLASDPREAKGEVDYNVVLTTGIDVSTGLFYVLDYFRKQCGPGETIDAIFDHVAKWHPIKVGYETGGYQNTIVPWIRRTMVSRGVYFTLEPINSSRISSKARIVGLQPFYANGQVMHRSWMKVLEEELLTVMPGGKTLGRHDDVADALGMQLDLWVMTKSTIKAIKQDDPESDPLSIAAAMKSIDERAGKGFKLETVEWDFGTVHRGYGYEN